MKLLRILTASLLLGTSGCIAMVAGSHQDISIESDLRDVDVALDGQSCTAPCTLNVRRQWASFHMAAKQQGRVIAEGPIYRRNSLANCFTKKDGTLLLPAIVDGLLIVPGIVDISMGITEFHPEHIIIEDGRYLLSDPCFDKPIVGGPL